MKNGVKAAIVHGAEDLVIVGDSRLAIQQSLGVIACRKESLLTLLNIHKELTAQLRSVKYLHVVREYNAAADSLATEALESKVSGVVLAETRKFELVTLNRIQEMIYESNEDTAEVVPREAEHHVHVLTGSESSHRKTFEHFVRDDTTIKNEYGNMAVMTRRQAKPKKHVSDEKLHVRDELLRVRPLVLRCARKPTWPLSVQCVPRRVQVSDGSSSTLGWLVLFSFLLLIVLTLTTFVLLCVAFNFSF
ncbi:hypothetical protein PC123_g7056 [Phytophthora cactorum]|nr:hypothetical protein PC120_g16628 [Phytophthora cactorum]KAG4057959.1 hypothetical protein PC123_g7056 [Phytophthora cactorum]